MMQISGAFTDVLAVLSTSCYRSPGFGLFHTFSDSKFLHPTGLFRKSCPFSIPKLENGLDKSYTRSWIVRASQNAGGNLIPVAPVEFESPVGQLLGQILQTHPHLLPAAVDQQLEYLQSDRDAQREQSSASSQDNLLYKRIAEVKEKNRQKALEEIIYCLIVQKFVDNGIFMIPKISTTSNPAARVDFWPNQEQKLESVHSPEALEMTLSHLSVVLGERVLSPLDSIVQMSKLKLGKLYAASIIYGYFLRRVDQRYQLERSMNTLPEDFGEGQVNVGELASQNPLWDLGSLIQIPVDNSVRGGLMESGEGKSHKLRSYLMHLDAETLQRYAAIRSKEAISLIEKQTQAIFGRPDVRVAEGGSLNVSNDEVIAVTFSGLTMLVLEAVAFGSFLWDTEGYVDTKYHFIKT